MKGKYILQTLVLFVFAFSSCETTEKIDDFPQRPAKTVVNCYFYEGSMWEFQVSESLSVLDGDVLKLKTDAEINIYKDGVLVDTIHTCDSDSWYRSDRALPVEGSNYSIEVTNYSNGNTNDTVTVRAEEYIPLKVDIIDASVMVKDSSFSYWEDPYGERYYDGYVEGTFNITIDDPAGVDNYYKLSISYVDTMENYYYRMDEFGNVIIDSIQKVPFNNNLYFTTSDAATGGKNENSSVMFDDYIFDGQDYTVIANFRDWNAKYGKAYLFELTSLSKSSYLYMKSVADYESAHGDPFSEPVRIYSNIENGLGIFASFSKNDFVYIPF